MTTRLARRLAEQRQERRHNILVLSGVLVLIITMAIAGYFMFGGTLFRHKTTSETLIPMSDSKINILVLGVNERQPDEGGALDSMVIVSIDRKDKSVFLLSVPRDTRVAIPDYGWDKINAAYAYGGNELVARSAEGLLGVPIDYYVQVNFKFLSRLVDILGGVDVTVEKPVRFTDGNTRLVTVLAPGMQHFDGRQVIEYVRCRDEKSDRDLIGRQQKIIKALSDKSKSAAVITRVPSQWDVYSNLVKTDLSLLDMLNLGILLNSKLSFSAATVPGTSSNIAGVNYWAPDIIALRKQVAMIAGISITDKYMADARALALEYRNSGPERVRVKPPSKPGIKPGVTKTPLPAAAVQPPPVELLHAEVVNASGLPEAGDKVASMLRAKGIDVSVITVSDPAANSVIITRSTQSIVLSKLTSLPFRYAFQVVKDDERASLVTVIIGKDFAGQN